MSSFGSLLRSSRVVSLPTAVKQGQSEFYPAHQAIRTTKANQDAGDWGLKRTLPNQRTKAIAVSAIDTQEHQTSFHAANRHTKVVKRWQEMGIPLMPADALSDQFSSSTRIAGLPDGDRHIPSMPLKTAMKEVGRAKHARTRFLNKNKELLGSEYSTSKLNRAKALATRFLGHSNAQIMPLHETGGLAYHPKGSLSLINTPQGPMEKQLTARILTQMRGQVRLGLGGIVAAEKYATVDKIGYGGGRDATVKVTPSSASFDARGELLISLVQSSSVPSDGFAASKRRGDLQAFSSLGFGGLEMEDRRASFSKPSKTKKTGSSDSTLPLDRIEAALTNFKAFRGTRRRE